MTTPPRRGRCVDSAPHLVVAWARATVGGADGVSVSLRRCDRSRTVEPAVSRTCSRHYGFHQRPRLESGPSRRIATMAEMPATERPADVLDQYRRDAGLSHSDLWLRYFELGA